MIAEIAAKHNEIVDLCKQYEVIRLGLFGSAARGDFDPETSDIDFLVLFDRREGMDYVRRYFGLSRDLESLFGLKVDLITEGSVKKERFRQAIKKDLVRIYERTGRATAA
jgi:uncharacterized protein